jgi:uncharacterized protein (TIGR00251 family)
MRITVQVQPNAKLDAVEYLGDVNFKLKTKAQPIDGKANLAVIEILSEFFEIPKSKVKILLGQNTRKKVIELVGLDNDDFVKKIPGQTFFCENFMSASL